ncbi:MAG: glycosyltransferase family 2 protein, partial [Oceanihabitans sp.]
MLQQPLVSIIIPTYNRAHLIGDTLNSVLAQTYRNWECIVVDDGSSDATSAVVNKYIAKDARFQFYNRPKNLPAGGNAARNYGFTKAKGKYIQWFDSDDIMYSNYLKTRLDVFIKYPKTNVVFCAFHYFNKNGLQERITNSHFSGDILTDLMYKQVYFSPLSYLLEKEIILNHKFDAQLKRAQDLDFFFKVFTSSKALTIKHVPDTLFKVRKHDNAISSKPEKSGKKWNSRFIVHKRILDY